MYGKKGGNPTPSVNPPPTPHTQMQYKLIQGYHVSLHALKPLQMEPYSFLLSQRGDF